MLCEFKLLNSTQLRNLAKETRIFYPVREELNRLALGLEQDNRVISVRSLRKYLEVGRKPTKLPLVFSQKSPSEGLRLAGPSAGFVKKTKGTSWSAPDVIGGLIRELDEKGLGHNR